MTHVGDELALRPVGGLGLALGLLQFGLASLHFGDVGEDPDDAVIGRAPLADPDPAAVGIVLLEFALRMEEMLEAALDPFGGRQGAGKGDAPLDGASRISRKDRPGTSRSAIPGKSAR